MKEEVIKCPACLKNSGYTTETDFLENQFESIYENRFATKNTNGYINDGFEVMCDRCGFLTMALIDLRKQSKNSLVVLLTHNLCHESHLLVSVVCGNGILILCQ
jgi:hypothetical protein